MKTNFKLHLRDALIIALGFGFGFLLGSFFSSLILQGRLLEPIRDLFQADRLVAGIVLLMLVISIGGGLGGAVGGLALNYVHQKFSHKWGYAWRSALSFGFSYGVILIPLTFAVALYSFYNPEKASPISLIMIVGLAGSIFGAVSGIILGLLTVGRDTWRVFLVSIIGFGLGGSALGYGLWGYFFGTEGFRNEAWLLFASLFVFGAIGGGALGYLYSWLAHRQAKTEPPLFRRLIVRFRGLKPAYQIAVLILLLFAALVIQRVWIVSPFHLQPATLSNHLKSGTIDTHWATPVNLSDNFFETAANDLQPDLFANENGNTALVWSREADGVSDIFFAARIWEDSDGAYHWLEPVNVSDSVANASTHPQVVIDGDDKTHIVWTEAADTGMEIFYSQCLEQTCTSPVRLSNPDGIACVTADPPRNDWPTVAIDSNDTLMLIWNVDQTALAYSIWPVSTTPPQKPAGCIPTPANITVQQPRVAATSDQNFKLVFDGDDEIYLTEYTGQSWSSSPEILGQGRLPQIFIVDNQTHIAWCDSDNLVTHRTPRGQNDVIAFPGCLHRPELGRGGNKSIRLVWYSDAVVNVNGQTFPNQLMYESIQREGKWTVPAIVSQLNEASQPVMATGSDDTLHLAWSDHSTGNLYYATHTEYNCRDVEVSGVTQTVVEIQRQREFRPVSDIIPFCHNQYEELVFAPNPEPVFSDQTPTPNGAFDKYAQLAKEAQYEVLFSTMWYDADENQDSPGSVLAQSIAELYRNLKADPSRYPRGLTVRILLGNPPQPVLFPMLDHQIANLLEDLKAAGISEMKNPEIGWNLEVANFDGSWPHSHTKLMVVDGKTAIAVGFNMQYEHYPAEHPSGLGNARVDLGAKVTGPVAQASQMAFDDLWFGSDRVHCPTLNTTIPFLWRFLCEVETATAEHVPEVLRFYVANTNSHAFSLYRTQEYREADKVYNAALAAAQSSIDTIQVNFTLNVICDLGVLLEVCNFNNALDYMQSMMAAIDNNGVKARILVEEGPIDGVENRIAIDVFQKELDARGLSDQVEIRYFDGDVHIKAALIDDEFLVVGSQNYHYSAWEDGLTEYSLAFDDPKAAEDFKRMFEYRWLQGKPVE